MTDKYNDIINLPHHRSKMREHMSIEDRAAQFAPFSALSGLGEAVSETARITDMKIEQDDSEREIIREKLSKITDKNCNISSVSITYFSPDLKKSGGRYITYKGRIKKTDIYRGVIVTEDDRIIEVDNIIDIYFN